MKYTAKKLGITINDFVIACLSSSIKQYFELKGDCETNLINLGLPANVRFQYYETLDELKLENKFSGINMKLPLIKNVFEGFKAIPEITKKFKNNFGEIYAIYASCKIFSMLCPYAITNLMFD